MQKRLRAPTPNESALAGPMRRLHRTRAPVRPNEMRLVLCAVLLLLLTGCRGGAGRDGDIYRFADLEGPEDASVVAEAVTTPTAAYGGGSASRMALLLTDTTSAWLGVAHGLVSIGVPFSVTTDPAEALRHRVIAVSPLIDGRTLSGDALRALARHVREGGVLIAFGVYGGLHDLFGIDSTREPGIRRTLTWTEKGTRQFGFEGPSETTLRLGGDGRRADVPTAGSVGYVGGTATVLARFDDGTAAVTTRTVGTGEAIAVGVDLASLAHLAHSGRAEGISSAFANTYTPVLDGLLRMLRTVYVRHEPDAVTLHPVPDGRELSLILTHDIDYSKSWEPSLAYSRLEARDSTPATYFVQTKYVRDWNDDLFFTDSTRRYLDTLRERGAEIGSHSVSHSRVHSAFDVGDGAERYPDYRPFVEARTKTRGGTVLGELRVSRFLLEHLGAPALASFRPGHLSYPAALPEALVATGYRYSSTTTANLALTHLPFRLTHNRASRAELPAWEFPITVEDELNGPMLDRLDKALALATSLRRYGGLFVVLIHPSAVDGRLTFQERLVAATKPHAWTGTLRDFGTWWSARDGVRVDVARDGDTERVVTLSAPDTLHNLALATPASWRPVQPLRRATGGWIVPLVTGRTDVRFTLP